MQMISKAATPEDMRDEISEYLEVQATVFARRKNTTNSITLQAQYDAIANAFRETAEAVKRIELATEEPHRFDPDRRCTQLPPGVTIIRKC